MRSLNGTVAEEPAQLSIRNITQLSRVSVGAVLALRFDHRAEESRTLFSPPIRM